MHAASLTSLLLSARYLWMYYKIGATPDALLEAAARSRTDPKTFWDRPEQGSASVPSLLYLQVQLQWGASPVLLRLGDVLVMQMESM